MSTKKLSIEDFEELNKKILQILGNDWQEYKWNDNLLLSYKYIPICFPTNIPTNEIRKLLEPYNLYMERYLIGGFSHTIGINFIHMN